MWILALPFLKAVWDHGPLVSTNHSQVHNLVQKEKMILLKKIYLNFLSEGGLNFSFSGVDEFCSLPLKRVLSFVHLIKIDKCIRW